MPEVTVLMVAGDDAAAAAATVHDLLGQQLRDIEVLVVSEERAELAALEAADRRVRIVPREPGPLGVSLNRGLALAQGASVARAVPGDRSAPDRLARQAGLLRAAAEVAFVGTGWRSVAADGVPGRVVSPPAGDAALRAAMAVGDAIGHPTATMRREAVVKAGGWREAFVDKEDYDLLLRLLTRSAGACSPEPLVDHVADEAVPGWRVLEQRILSELAAVAAYDRRQAGRPDHGDRLAPADRSLLHRMGMVDDEITRAVVGRAHTMALTAGLSGQWRVMREAATLGLQQQGLHKNAKAPLVGLWLRGLARIRPLDPQGDAPSA